MNHCGTQKLETDRLILRRYVIEDAAAMYNNWASDKEVTKYLMWQPHPSLEISRKVTEAWVNQYSDKSFYHWAIVLKENGDEPIGDIAVVNMNEETSAVHIGYCIGRAWWHNGITSEALKAAPVSVVKKGFPVPAAKITTLDFSRCLIALNLIYGSAILSISIAD